jgi:RHS repeat-associated protein
LPTAAPTLTPIPDTNYTQQAIDAARDALIAEVSALPALTQTITGTLVSGLTGGKITTDDESFTLGLRPGSALLTDTLNVLIEPRTFQEGDPRATRNGKPLAYTFELTATNALTGDPITGFAKDAVLSWTPDATVLAQAGITGTLHIYTYSEQSSQWEEVPSQWDPATNQLIATTPHFSLYAAGGGFDKVNNYLPSVSNFEMNLQSGTASLNYPIDVPAAPGGFAPKVSLSYNSGGIERVDVSNQGPSSVGWGWSLSTSYIAATQHHFAPCGQSGSYHPWTASIVVDGVNGDLTKGDDDDSGTYSSGDYWHTSIESFARVKYNPGSGRTSDWWEAWTKDGTHYVFDKRALDEDMFNRPGGCGATPTPPAGELTTYKWMLSKATDVHGNVINYSYWYQPDDDTYTDTPITGAITRAVYPKDITYGADSGTGQTKAKVTFNITDRTLPGSKVDDISDNDEDEEEGRALYQSYRIEKIETFRWQGGTVNDYVRQRSYALTQDYTTVLEDWDKSLYEHLTLREIIPRAGDDTTRLPSTTYDYYQEGCCTGETFAQEDWGHIYKAKNGYGGEVSYFYDAAGEDVGTAYRRVRSRWVMDGIDANNPPSPGVTTSHFAKYYYDYRGAAQNTKSISAAVNIAGNTRADIHLAGSEFRGFTWAREQDPSGQVTDHYFAQDDQRKAKEWRVQVGKAEVLSDHMDAPTGTPTGTATWTLAGSATPTQEPGTSNNVLRVAQGGAMTRTGTVGDGYDVQMRFQIKERYDPNRAHPFAATYKLENTCSGCTDYWGIKVYSSGFQGNSFYRTFAQVFWNSSVSGTTGTHDLRGFPPASEALPYQPEELYPNVWYVMHLHTSPDGRFVAELYREDSTNYVMVASSDPKDNGGIVPPLPTGQAWRFTHTVTNDGTASYYSYIDDYYEHRTVYSQSDTVYDKDHGTFAPALDYVGQSPYVGQDNNCRGMLIEFVPVVETSSTTYGTGDELGQVKRTKTEYEYDTYGNQTFVKDYGDANPSVTADDRSTRTYYVNAINPTYGQYIVGKVKQVLQYSDLEGTDPATIAESQYFYDNQSSYGEIPTPTALPSLNGRANLTKVKQVGIVGGIRTAPHAEQQFGYDQYGHQTTVRDPNYTTQNNTTITTTYETDYDTFPVTVTYPNGKTDTTQYNWQRSTVLTDTPLDAVTSMTSTNGLVTEMRYDRFGRPRKVWSSGSTSYGSESYPNQEFIFADYNDSSETAPFPITYKMKVGPTDTDITWQTRWYDGRGRTVQDVSPKDATNSIIVDTTYYPNGQVESSSLPYTLSNSTNDPQKVFTPDTTKPKVVKLYDGLGRPSEVRNPDYHATTNPNSHVIYDYGLFQTVGTVDESGHYKWQHTDILGRLDWVREQDNTTYTPDDVYTQYFYNDLNQLIEVRRDATGSPLESTMAYDGLGRKKSMVDPDMGTWKYEYDLVGNLTVQTDTLHLSNPTMYPDHEIFFQYDNMNRIKAKYYGDAHWNGGTNGTPDVKYYYDNDLATGGNPNDADNAHSWGKLRLAEVTKQGQGNDKANGHSYEYDQRGLLVKEVVTTTLSSRAYETLYSYDKGGRLVTTTYPDPLTTHEAVTNHYNTQGLGLPSDLTSSISSNNPNPVLSATYNARGQLETLVQGTSSSSSNKVTTTYAYDDTSTKRGWLTNTTVKTGTAPNETTILNLGLSYYDNGNVYTVSQSSNDTGNTTFSNSFFYDGLDRLRQANSTGTNSHPELFTDEEYDFDELGRMTERTLGGTVAHTIDYGDAAHIDAPTSYKGSQYGYDTNGNQTIRSTTSSNLNQTRTFDPENRISQIISNTSGVGPTITDFIYDANGARLIKSVSTATPTAGLKGEYYDNTDFTSLKMTRFDGPIDFDWGSNAPDASMGSDTFSVRWTGKVEAPTTGKYFFYTISNDGVRLWVNNTLLIDEWNDHAQTEHSESIMLDAGVKYDIKLEYYDNTGTSIIQLEWDPPCSGVCIGQAAIPLNRLYAPAPVSGDLGKQYGEGVAWTGKVNVTSSTNTIVKSGGGYGWNAGASSTISIPEGSDGYVQVTADVNNQDRMFGLSNGDQNQNYTDIDYALHLKGDGWVDVYEGGVFQNAYTTYVAGDVFRVAVESGVVKYYKNATLIDTSSQPPTYPLGVDTSIQTPGAKLKNVMLYRSRTHAVAQRTLYVGGLYEEELVGPNGIQYTTSNTPYTSYYTFGGKMVGMRRANQGTANGQYRMVSDHLGSSTVVLDASSPPSVVSRQYHTPYGEVGWSGGSAMTSLTSVGYTGQRLDTDSGLMFYNARMYDPVLSQFVSADTIVSDPSDPKTRQRYSYVSNNPLKYVDPSGHCTAQSGYDDPGACERARHDLRQYGFDVNLDDWDLEQLEWILEAIHDVLTAANRGIYDYGSFKKLMGFGSDYKMIYNMDKAKTDPKLYQGCSPSQGACVDPYGKFIAIAPNDGLKDPKFHLAPSVEFRELFKYAFVHELGHLMDRGYSGVLDRFEVTQSYNCSVIGRIPRCISERREREPSVSPRGDANPGEDWAETFATTVYPKVITDGAVKLGLHNPYAGKHRFYGLCVLQTLGNCSLIK